MPALSSRLADTLVLSAGADPLTGNTASEITFTMPTPLNNIVTDTSLTEFPGSRIKTIAVVVTTGLTWVTSGQPTVQLFAARSKYGVLGGDTGTGMPGAGMTTSPPSNPFLGFEGAASGFPTGTAPNASALIGTTATLGPAAATTLATGIYWFSPSALAELQWWYPVLGVEVKFPSALTAGAFSVFAEVAPI